MKDFSEFIELIHEFIKLFESLISIEQKKLDAAVDNKVTFVEDCMNQEQAAVLKLRGLEIKREKIQQQLGMEEFTFRQIVENAPPDVSSVLTPLFQQLSEQVKMFQAVSSSAKEAIEVNLHVIQNLLASGASGQNTYSSSGDKEKKGEIHFTSRSV